MFLNNVNLKELTQEELYKLKNKLMQRSALLRGINNNKQSLDYLNSYRNYVELEIKERFDLKYYHEKVGSLPDGEIIVSDRRDERTLLDFSEDEYDFFEVEKDLSEEEQSAKKRKRIRWRL